MVVQDIMQGKVITAPPSMSLAQAQHLMQQHHIRHLPVVAAGQRLIGLLTNRDIRRLQASDVLSLAVYEGWEPTATLTVQEAMVTEVVSVASDTPVTAAGQLLLTHRFGCLPVIRDDGVLEGIISVRDLVWAYVQQQGRGS